MSLDLSKTCPAGPAAEPEYRMATGNPAMGGTGLEPAPPPNDSARQGATRSDRNPPFPAGFALLGATNRDTARHRATAPGDPICPKPVQPGPVVGAAASPAGRTGGERPLQTSLVDGNERPVGPMIESVMWGDNATVIAAIAPLYLTGSVLDVTYGHGAWWKRVKPEPFGFHDLALDGVDFRALPYEDNSWDAVCFDPPYLPSRAVETSTKRGVTHRNAYGLTVRRSRRELDELIATGLAEAARVARTWVLAKCCDYAENPHVFRLGHVTTIVAGEAAALRVHDLIIHAGGTGPTNPSLRVVRRARRAHSYLIVFRAGEATA